MKILIVLIVLFSFQKSTAQSYEQLMDLAATQIKLEKYNQALLTFQKAFKKDEDKGKYDYANASVVALRCGKIDMAIEWLDEGLKLGLGDNEQELSYFKNDSIFKSIIDNPTFKRILVNMEARIQEKYKLDKIWQEEILTNAISRKQAPYQLAQPGFALYHIQLVEHTIPYLVFVPKGYQCDTPIRTLFFLHGGVSAHEASLTVDPQTRFEPIFTIGDNTNSIIVYPFQKGNPGWKDYDKCSALISAILDEVKLRYHINTNSIYLGGLSLGGNICYRFAQEQNTPFSAFYTLSARPKVTDFESRNGFHALANPIYSLHAKDDSVYTYEDLMKVYQQVEKQTKNWILKSVENGGHGFSYLPAGKKPTLEFFRMIFNKEEE
ncbi:hypothetical protein [Sphingobacterium sp.]|uniref:hypothetical protein n=1 Tax=Sphingobacterium sp. TaxID=341027 RepID=UPI0031D8CD98